MPYLRRTTVAETMLNSNMSNRYAAAQAHTGVASPKKMNGIPKRKAGANKMAMRSNRPTPSPFNERARTNPRAIHQYSEKLSIQGDMGR